MFQKLFFFGRILRHNYFPKTDYQLYAFDLIVNGTCIWKPTGY